MSWYMWLAIIILLTLVEVMTINLTTIWFVISGIFALILSLFIDSFLIEFTVFTVGGILLLIITRPILKKYLNHNNEHTNLDRIIGMEGIVTEKITKNINGEVKVDGKRWTAYADKKIDKDEIVKILKIDGVKIKVERVEE